MQHSLTRPTMPAWRSLLATLVRTVVSPKWSAAPVTYDRDVRLTDQMEREFAEREFNRWR